ncbi:MAG: APC family permease [Thermotogae bacterium]|nr:APC family permease [Thermotogota bacterium]
MNERKLNFWDVVAIGVGGMVGGGIFAVLGLTLSLAKGGAPISFLLAGLVALLTSYSYAKLSLRYPSEGGTVEFLIRAFGNNLFTSYLNTLLLASYIIMLALYSYAFGSYASALFTGSEIGVAVKIFIVGVLFFFGIINALGSYISGKSEDIMVALKVGILLLFVVIGFTTGDLSRLSPENWSKLVDILTGGFVIFLAYEGFELIANASHDVHDPQRVLPRAYYTAVSLVIVLYVMVSAVAAANLTPEEVERYKDYALAVAAKPALGHFGFVLIGIAALLSTASAINATLYGSSRISYLIAKFGELPRTLEKKVWKNATEGLLLIVVLSALFALFTDLENISMAGSVGFLLIFTSVNVAHFILRKETKSNVLLILLAIVSTVAASVILVTYNLKASPNVLRGTAVVLFGTLLFEGSYRILRGVNLRRYVDWRLKDIEENFKRREEHLKKLQEAIKRAFPDAQVEVEELPPHVRINVTTSRDWKDEKKLESKLKEEAGLEKHHTFHLKFRKRHGTNTLR